MNSDSNLEGRVSAYRFVTLEKSRVYIGIGALGPQCGITQDEYHKVDSILKSGRITKIKLNSSEVSNGSTYTGKPYITLDLEIQTLETIPRFFSYQLMFNDIIDFLMDLNVDDINIRDIDNPKFTTNKNHDSKKFV